MPSPPGGSASVDTIRLGGKPNGAQSPARAYPSPGAAGAARAPAAPGPNMPPRRNSSAGITNRHAAAQSAGSLWTAR